MLTTIPHRSVSPHVFDSPSILYRRLCEEEHLRCNRMVELQFADCCLVCAHRNKLGLDDEPSVDYGRQEEPCTTTTRMPTTMSRHQEQFTIDLSNNYLGGRGVEPVVRVMQHFDFVQRLNLDRSMLDSGCVVKICEALRSTTMLRWLSLVGNSAVGAIGGRALESFACSHPHVEDILVDQTGIPQFMIATIGEVIERNRLHLCEGEGSCSRRLGVKLQSVPTPKITSKLMGSSSCRPLMTAVLPLDATSPASSSLFKQGSCIADKNDASEERDEDEKKDGERRMRDKVEDGSYYEGSSNSVTTVVASSSLRVVFDVALSLHGVDRAQGPLFGPRQAEDGDRRMWKGILLLREVMCAA